MTEYVNELGQKVGEPLPDWAPPPLPERERMAGRTCALEPLSPARHTPQLYAAFSRDTDGSLWTYMPSGPFGCEAEFMEWAETASRKTDPQFYAIIDSESGLAVGVASYLRIDPNNGCIEVGHLAFSPALQRTTASTEAMYLMMRRAFDLGYRRYEWKCNALNEPSRMAALRLGFTFEGIFRQAVVVKGRNRDTAWYSVIDTEWPERRAAFERWLDPANFDAEGKQINKLGERAVPSPRSRGEGKGEGRST